MKRTKVIAALSATATLALAAPTAASAQSPPPGAFVVRGMGGHVWGENALPGHGYRYPVTLQLVTASGQGDAGVKIVFFFRQAWTYGPGNPALMKPTASGPLFKTSAGLSDSGVGITNSQGIATSPPVVAEGPTGSTWIECADMHSSQPWPSQQGPMWLLSVT